MTPDDKYTRARAAFATELLDTARTGLKRVHEYLRAPSTKRLPVAKIGAVTAATYARYSATLANERALALMERRQLLPSPEERA